MGAPPEVCVTKGDHVKKGSCIAQPASFVSVPLHSPVAGTVGDLLTVPGPNGSPVEAVEILSDGEDMQEWDDRLEPILDWRDTPANVLKKRILDAGITGMGGGLPHPCETFSSSGKIGGHADPQRGGVRALSYFRRRSNMTSLSPDIAGALLAGIEPDELSIAKLVEQSIPEGLNEQRFRGSVARVRGRPGKMTGDGLEREERGKSGRFRVILRGAMEKS